VAPIFYLILISTSKNILKWTYISRAEIHIKGAESIVQVIEYLLASVEGWIQTLASPKKITEKKDKKNLIVLT
jgi:hypothetical protein